MVATTEVRYENGRFGYEGVSDEETLERWVAHPGEIQRIVILQDLECAKERLRKEHSSEQNVAPLIDNDDSEDTPSIIGHRIAIAS